MCRNRNHISHQKWEERESIEYSRDTISAAAAGLNGSKVFAIFLYPRSWELYVSFAFIIFLF